MSAMHGQDLSDVWTPKLVGERLVEAQKWVRYNAGPTGPASVRAASIPFLPTDDDFEIEGWGQREKAEQEDDQPAPRRYSPAKVSAILAALEWPGKYLVPEYPDAARYLHKWLRCKVYRGNFEKAIEAEGRMSRMSAYRYRDRALSVIAQGLTRDGVPVN